MEDQPPRRGNRNPQSNNRFACAHWLKASLYTPHEHLKSIRITIDQIQTKFMEADRFRRCRTLACNSHWRVHWASATATRLRGIWGRIASRYAVSAWSTFTTSVCNRFAFGVTSNPQHPLRQYPPPIHVACMHVRDTDRCGMFANILGPPVFAVAGPDLTPLGHQQRATDQVPFASDTLPFFVTPSSAFRCSTRIANHTELGQWSPC